MFLLYRLRAVVALTLITAVPLLTSHVTMAQTFAPQASSPAPQTPPILSLNDSRNPFHYTPDQQRKFYALKEQYQMQAAAVAQNSSLTMQQKQTQITALQKSAFDQFNATLTPSQLVKVKAASAKAEGRQKLVIALRAKNMGKYKALGDQLTASLTPAQKQQVVQIRSSATTQANSIRTGNGSDEQKQEQMMQLQQSFQQQTMAVLTGPQKALVSQMQTLNAAEPAEEAKIMSGN